MARVGQIQAHKEARVPQVAEHTEFLTRHSRVKELRQLVERGAYRISPQRLALKILVKALQVD